MKTAILLCFLLLSNLGGNVFTKLSSNIAANSKKGYALFLTINSVAACLFFWITGGFSLRLNAVTFGYAAAFAAVVFVSLVLNLYVYRYIQIASVTVIRSASSLVLGTVIGCALFQEVLTGRDMIRIALMFFAVILVSVSACGTHGKVAYKQNWKGFAALTFLVASGGASMIVQKYFAVDSRVTDENSFFFFTNVILLFAVVPWLVAECRHGSTDRSNWRMLLKPFPFAYIANTVCSNIGSLITVWLLETMAVSLFTPLSTAFGIIAGVMASLLFRERIGIHLFFAAGLSVLAVII